jgi:hypothetical protein
MVADTVTNTDLLDPYYDADSNTIDRVAGTNIGADTDANLDTDFNFDSKIDLELASIAATVVDSVIVEDNAEIAGTDDNNVDYNS